MDAIEGTPEEFHQEEHVITGRRRVAVHRSRNGQALVHQRVDTNVGDTYCVQFTAAPSTANALVDIHDTTPSGDQWNYAAAEIVATRQ
jgi:hypothetical protein